MPDPKTAAVILTHNRPDMLRDAVAAIVPQVGLTIVIDNASDPRVPLTLFDGIVADDHVGMLTYVPDQPPVLPNLWALGQAMGRQQDVRFCAFLCDDTAAPPGWFDAVTAAMAETGAVAGCTNPFGDHHAYIHKTAPDADLMHRMVGWAFVLDLNAPIVPDPSMPWWWSDTDLDWQARQHGGMVMVGGGPGLNVPNLRPNDHTMHYPGLAEQSGKDRATWALKWGANPW